MTVSINGRYSHNYIDGVLVKETLNPANETVARGHYAATTLSAVDADLATANIKNGITIFGKLGVDTVQDIADADAAVGDVKSPKTFYSVTGGRKTGTMATVAITAVNDDYPAGYHAGNAGGLDAIDTDLAPENIKSGVTIFGKLGTLSATLAEDTKSVTSATQTCTQTTGESYPYDVGIGGTADIVSKTDDYDAASLAIAHMAAAARCSGAAGSKVRLWMDGVQMAETAYVSTTGENIGLSASRAMSGTKTCKVSMWSNDGSALYFFAYTGRPIGCHLCIGSIKLA